MAAKPNNYIVQPVFKALKVLELVAEKGHDVSLTEVATELKLPKTTVFRYLQTLTAASFLRHDAQKDRYGVGGRFRSLARIDKSLHGLRTLAMPEMSRLLELFNETINLAIVSEGHVVYVEMLEAKRTLRMQARLGDRHPMHSTSLGKAILAFLPEEKRKTMLTVPLDLKTINTVTDRAALMRQLADIRRRGYAIETGENEDGSMCIGVPIFDEDAYPVAALSLSAPERRMSTEITVEAVAMLRKAAAAVSAALGYAPEAPPAVAAAR